MCSRSSPIKGRSDTEKKGGMEGLTFRSCWILQYDYIVRRRNRRKDSRAREVMVLKWEEVESQAGARAKRWKEDISGEVMLVMLDLIDLC